MTAHEHASGALSRSRFKDDMRVSHGRILFVSKNHEAPLIICGRCTLGLCGIYKKFQSASFDPCTSSHNSQEKSQNMFHYEELQPLTYWANLDDVHEHERTLHLHTFIYASEANALCEHTVYSEADLEAVLLLCPWEQMSLALTQYFFSFSLSVCCLAVSLSFPLYLLDWFSQSFNLFYASTKWRDAPLQTSLTQDHNAPSHVMYPANFSLSISLSLCHCLSISTRTPSFSVSFPPWQRQTKAFHFPLACLLSVYLYCTKLDSLSHCIPFFSLQRRCLGALGPLLWNRGPASAWWRVWRISVVSEGERGGKRRKRVYYFI